MFSFFDSEEEKKKSQRLEQIQNQKQDPKDCVEVPNKNFKYDEEGILNFKVVQENIQITIHTYRQQPPKQIPAKAICLIFHGLNSYCGTTAHIAHFLSEQGIIVLGMDHRGFGKSEGIRGYFESQQLLEEDVAQFEKLAREKHPNLPVFLTGQSWGGQVSFTMALKNPQAYRGIILFAPAIKDNDANSKFGKKFVGILGSLIPKVGILEQTRGSASRNKNVEDEYYNNPLNYRGKLIPGTIKAILNQQTYCYQNYEKLQTPFLVIMGGTDKIVDPDIGFEMLKRCPAQDKEQIYYEKMWHNVWGEPEIHEILPKVREWILKRI